jgi:uncharacterized membrane protein
MKWNDYRLNHGLIISVLIILLSVAIIGTVAAADPPAGIPGSWGNSTSPMTYHQNMTASGGMWGHANMMRGLGYGRGMKGSYPGMRSSVGAMHGTGGSHMAFMFLGIILAGLLMVVWLIVGILVIVLLLRKLRKDKTP